MDALLAAAHTPFEAIRVAAAYAEVHEPLAENGRHVVGVAGRRCFP